MSIQSTKQLQQSEIFFVLFLMIVVATIVLWADAEKNKPPNTGQATQPKKPPIITLPEASGYRFESGSAELSDEFQTRLASRIIPLLQAIADTFQVNVIEVIGHTDGQIVRMGGRAGNLDLILEDIAGSLDPNKMSSLIPYSNADLGLMRALAIIKFIKTNTSTWVHSEHIIFRPYSAAQLLMPDGNFAYVDREPDAERRRIEIRFTRLSDNH